MATADLERTPSASSQESDVVVLEWEGPDDPGNPLNWPLHRKWIVTAIPLFTTFTTLMNGTIITVAHEQINEEFGISDASFPHSYWPVTSWTIGGAFFSLLILPVMEDFGIRRCFLGTYLIFLCFIIPQGLAHNFATLIITRFFCGGCVMILANTVASVIGNVWRDERERNMPVSLYILAYLSGSSIGPVIGAAILQHLSWRWISYLQVIWFGALFPIYYFLFRESRGAVILAQRARHLRAKGQNVYAREELNKQPSHQMLLASIKRPLQLLCTESVIFVSTLWSAFTVGTLYLFTQTVEQVFSGLYGWNAVQAGYVQAAIVVGQCLGWTTCFYSAKLYFDSARRNTEIPGAPIPEARLYTAVAGGILGIAGGMFTYAWTSYPNIPWVAPAVGLAMVGAGSVTVVCGIADYVVDAYSYWAGSAVATVALGENIFSAFLPLAAQSMYNTLHFQWASTLLALISLALAFAPVLVLIWGREIRARSPFMRQSMLEKRQEIEVLPSSIEKEGAGEGNVPV
ncbi:putative MFS transporter [Aspergillus japonicus CBS 114.51]|uniref:Putative MFS transporter n=1 Tax=Aspergillus japonicus CBS 114.51 TaxID=1448312 RepID=A0A8T8WT04_ASPJA|nr:putative MFS transporter [Aspergillus japonicus CBS 114.51]RAH78873.1 putative MFS transporter [Aspergillus japonicus CBS 114.51]